MNRILKSISIIAFILSANTSFAECNIDSELKLIKFSPSGLSAYVPRDTLINKTVYDGPEGFDAIYDITYKSQKITFHISRQLEPFHYSFYEGIKLPNISDTAQLLKKECGDKICSKAYLDLDSQGSIYDDEFYYTDSISYTSTTIENSETGDEFVKSLFVDKSDCKTEEPDSLIYNGPSEISMFYFEPNSVAIPNQYYDNEQFKHFANNVSRKNYSIVIEGYTSKDEVETVGGSEDYSIALSKQRAEALKELLIDNYGMSDSVQVDIRAKGSNWPVALSTNKEKAKMNHRARAYIDTRNSNK